MEMTWPLYDGRLTLRPAAPADAEAFFEYQGRPECQAFVSRTVETIQDVRAFITERTATSDMLLCALVLDGQVVGDIGGRRYRPESLGPAPTEWDFYLGYSVHPAMWGQGLATAAVELLTSGLHEQGSIRRIVAKAFARNEASIRVLLKNGFILEGTERAAVLGRDGTWLDDCTLAHWR